MIILGVLGAVIGWGLFFLFLAWAVKWVGIMKDGAFSLSDWGKANKLNAISERRMKRLSRKARGM